MFSVSDVIIIFALTCLTGIVSLIVVAICYSKVPTSSNYKMTDALAEVNAVLRDLRVKWRKRKIYAVLAGLFVFWRFYMQLMRGNQLAFVAVSMFNMLCAVVIAIVTVGLWDVLMIIINYLKTKLLQ